MVRVAIARTQSTWLSSVTLATQIGAPPRQWRRRTLQMGQFKAISCQRVGQLKAISFRKVDPAQREASWGRWLAEPQGQLPSITENPNSGRMTIQVRRLPQVLPQWSAVLSRVISPKMPCLAARSTRRIRNIRTRKTKRTRRIKRTRNTRSEAVALHPRPLPHHHLHPLRPHPPHPHRRHPLHLPHHRLPPHQLQPHPLLHQWPHHWPHQWPHQWLQQQRPHCQVPEVHYPKLDRLERTLQRLGSMCLLRRQPQHLQAVQLAAPGHSAPEGRWPASGAAAASSPNSGRTASHQGTPPPRDTVGLTAPRGRNIPRSRR
mmetsp:Transcript_90557/g.234825  ORF Transcript_90557/g.234825 Transcript_90557/m.234825 type:complete len:317 (+) Transcript_90557:135-1085(+)